MNHHPILGFSSELQKDGSIAFRSGNLALQEIMEKSVGNRLFPASVQTVLSGHVHLYQSLTFASDHPAQFVVGNSGSDLHALLPNDIKQHETPYVNAQLSHFKNAKEMGFVLMTREDRGWLIQAWSKDARLLETCRL